LEIIYQVLENNELHDALVWLLMYLCIVFIEWRVYTTVGYELALWLDFYRL